jgi:hypothetical protein
MIKQEERLYKFLFQAESIDAKHKLNEQIVQFDLKNEPIK